MAGVEAGAEGEALLKEDLLEADRVSLSQRTSLRLPTLQSRCKAQVRQQVKKPARC